MRTGLAARVAPALFGLAAAAFAHDFWIEPSSFRPAVGSELFVSLRVGQDFQGDPVPRNPALVQRFALVTAGGEVPIGGLPGADPAGSLRVPGPGVLWIAYRSGRSPVTLEAEKFEKYLAEEGLEGIVQVRSARGESGKPGREVFSRSVKSMLVAGDAPEAGRDFDRALGLTLEIVPRRDPRRIFPGGRLPVSLLYEGRPLPGALVVAMSQAASGEKIRARTDARGEAMLELARPGVWLVKAVHMVPAPPGLGADWESVWTSLTLQIP
ncbi:MAG: DUF4198 domain-containing protein [Acidobacteriota bacterium]